jgi:hypothetical protein
MRDRGNDPATASYAAGLAPATQYPPGDPVPAGLVAMAPLRRD